MLEAGPRGSLFLPGSLRSDDPFLAPTTLSSATPASNLHRLGSILGYLGIFRLLPTVPRAQTDTVFHVVLAAIPRLILDLSGNLNAASMSRPILGLSGLGELRARRGRSGSGRWDLHL